MDWELMWDSLPKLLAALPVTLELVGGSLLLGAVVAFVTALLRLSGNRVAEILTTAYVFVFRGTPLLVQIFLIYYGLGQFEFVRDSVLWPFLREPMWCAILALTLNTGAYTSEILRGAILSVPLGQVEAARACGMSRALAFRRIVLPVAVRQMLPAYGNEVILMVKASSLASTITLLEVTGLARKIISQSFAVFEIFILAGAIYLLLNFLASRLIKYAEWRLTPYLRARA
ncbi:octopine/nopaline transport system permease protein [Azospirillum agricola]|uniref:ABC transporter permease n=1 Tax=Azospirillum agricola TaxID=1720247 RepID=UPI001AE526A0|nr:ABC transporter permease [Azospirillum agricola]MBP2229749.1 octopine/nopaline transport system permease protein [Azospirillum agricola]